MLVTCWTVGVKCLMSTVNREKYIKEPNRCLTWLHYPPYVRQQRTSQIELHKSIVMKFQLPTYYYLANL
jgi:hypothetical protein